METHSERGKVPPPYPIAMVVCDSIHRDPGTGKAFILGCFSVIHAKQFPATHQKMGLYVSITNGRGDVPVRVALVDADEEREPILSLEQVVEFDDPRLVAELTFEMHGVTFPEPGEYRFQLFALDEFIMEQRILVHELPEDTDNDR